MQAQGFLLKWDRLGGVGVWQRSWGSVVRMIALITAGPLITWYAVTYRGNTESIPAMFTGNLMIYLYIIHRLFVLKKQSGNMLKLQVFFCFGVAVVPSANEKFDVLIPECLQSACLNIHRHWTPTCTPMHREKSAYVNGSVRHWTHTGRPKRVEKHYVRTNYKIHPLIFCNN